MRGKGFIATLLVLLITMSGTVMPAEQSPTDIKGDWLGALKVAGMELRLVIKIKTTDQDSLTATMDSPDQGATDIPIDKVTFSGDTLQFEAAALMISYIGTIDSTRSTITGMFTQYEQKLPLTLERTEQAPEVKRPQEPKPPFPYDEEEVRYEGTESGVSLAGTLTLPPSEEPVPAVLLITGSGLQDRNETIMGHKPFLVLADYLTRQGIAVLRVDDRGVFESKGDISAATTEDFANDALSGVRFLKTRPEIDTAKIGLIGHSEGGLIAPMLATQNVGVAFIVMMAGPGLPGEQILYEQGRLVLEAEGADENVLIQQRLLQEKIFHLIKENPGGAELEEKLRELLNEEVQNLSEEERGVLNLSEEAMDVQVKSVSSPWFQFFLTYDPGPTLKEVRCPVLAVIGEKDLQVPPKENLRAIKEALAAGGNQQFIVREMPRLNHLFQTAETGAVSEYSKIEETLSPDFLKLVGDWIIEQTK
ncbi:MAG: alpha/beta fold hydrolase [candidate division Zixibacteria bacterium]|nr:alpha/beta fold hydrolase [candidate division Zixibacteria bacterium]